MLSKRAWILGGAALLATPANATEPSATSEQAIAIETIVEAVTAEEAAAAAVVGQPAEVATPAGDDQLATLADDELTDLRGGDAMVIGDQTLIAVTTGNVINGDYTAGNVSLSDFALSNFNGFGNLLINTGGQVSLNSGMNVVINVGE